MLGLRTKSSSFTWVWYSVKLRYHAFNPFSPHFFLFNTLKIYLSIDLLTETSMLLSRFQIGLSTLVCFITLPTPLEKILIFLWKVVFKVSNTLFYSLIKFQLQGFRMLILKQLRSRPCSRVADADWSIIDIWHLTLAFGSIPSWWNACTRQFLASHHLHDTIT
jgi:hypothetical protein